MGSDDPRVTALLKQGYAAGTLHRWGEAEREGARRFFLLLAKLGGAELLGSATALPAGTFWKLAQP